MKQEEKELLHEIAAEFRKLQEKTKFTGVAKTGKPSPVKESQQP